MLASCRRAALHVGRGGPISAVRPLSFGAHTADGAFADVYDDLSERFLHDKLNRANRNIVFRPRRAKELLSRKNPIIIDGKLLKPLEYKGVPGSKDLFHLIGSISCEDNYKQAKEILLYYGRYARNSVDAVHLEQFVRQAGYLGLQTDAFRFVVTHELFADRIDGVVHQEALRIRAIHSELARRPNYQTKILRSYKLVPEQTRGLSCCLLAIAGLVNCAIHSEGTARELIKTKLQGLINNCKELVDNAAIVEPSTDIFNYVRFPFYVDCQLGAQGLERATVDLGIQHNIDVHKLRDIANLWGKAFKNNEFENYVDNIKNGFRQSPPPSPPPTEEPSE
jgi:hypothetical protein